MISLVAASVALLAYNLDFAPDGPVASPAPRAARIPQPGVQLPRREALGEPRGDLFAGAPHAAATFPDVKPAALARPPLPYRFAGVLHAEDGLQVLLAKGDQIIRIKQGDALEGGYRVAAIGDGRIEIVFEPLGTTEILEVGAALALEAPRQRGPAGAANLRWEGPVRVQVGSDFSVTLRVSYDRPLRAAPMQLHFVPGVLEARGVRAGKFFDRGNFSYHVNAEGSIFIGASAGGGLRPAWMPSCWR